MENYENLGTIGEGTYGVVLKARHKVTGQLVAIKKFKESDQDEQVRKTALREIRILKQLKHENIVSLLEVFRRKGKLYLVFEYVERTILEDLENNPDGLDPIDVKKILYQLFRALNYIHSHNIIHRDIKPENLLVSKNGVLKLCDFGFARTLSRPGAKYTDYVATRWYRAPELLVGDTEYGPAVDVWAAGCMFAETINGNPLFPGESDIDQLYQMMKCFGQLTPRHMEIFSKNPLYVGIKLPVVKKVDPLDRRFRRIHKHSLSLLKRCLRYEPDDRETPAQLLRHPLFEGLRELFEEDIRRAVAKDRQDNVNAMKEYQRKFSRGHRAGSSQSRRDAAGSKASHRIHGLEPSLNKENKSKYQPRSKHKDKKSNAKTNKKHKHSKHSTRKGSDADDAAGPSSGLPLLNKPATPPRSNRVSFPTITLDLDEEKSGGKDTAPNRKFFYPKIKQATSSTSGGGTTTQAGTGRPWEWSSSYGGPTTSTFPSVNGPLKEMKQSDRGDREDFKAHRKGYAGFGKWKGSSKSTLPQFPTHGHYKHGTSHSRASTRSPHDEFGAYGGFHHMSSPSPTPSMDLTGVGYGRVHHTDTGGSSTGLTSKNEALLAYYKSKHSSQYKHKHKGGGYHGLHSKYRSKRH